jgi:cytochrome c
MHHSGRLLSLLISVIALALAIWLILEVHNRRPEIAASDLIGDPVHGRQVVLDAGCGACHEISGIPAAHGTVGPSLTNVPTQNTIAGVLVNTPTNMARWIESPRKMDPQTAMPDLGLNTKDATDAAAYLYAQYARPER